LLVHGQAAVVGWCVEPASALGIRIAIVGRDYAVSRCPLFVVQ
jgi:hypothetical protein